MHVMAHGSKNHRMMCGGQDMAKPCWPGLHVAILTARSLIRLSDDGPRWWRYMMLEGASK
jgi:hypothetical protein